MRLKPAEPNTGIVFQRVDLHRKPLIKADVDNVIETNRSTTIEAHGARVSTIEHLMASLVGMQIDNVLIEIDGEDPDRDRRRRSAYPGWERRALCGRAGKNRHSAAEC